MLIFNPGTSTFDPWLMSHCNYLLSDELYDGTRTPTSSENLYLSRIIVVTQGITTPTAAATIADGARAHGFGYSYVCDSYTILPTWLVSYMSLSTQPPVIPLISNIGGTLYSSAADGNQWFLAPGPAISGATSQSYHPTAAGTYYAIVTIDGCSSDTSNMIAVLPTQLGSANLPVNLHVYPNPASGKVLVTDDSNNPGGTHYEIRSMTGSVLLSGNVVKNPLQIDVSGLPSGLYVIYLKSEFSATSVKLTVTHTE